MNKRELHDTLLTVLQQAYLCHALYRGKEGVKAMARHVGAKFQMFEASYCSAAALIFGDHTHISVCGTNDPHDWVQNLSARHITYDHRYTVHAGFATSADLLLHGFERSNLFSAVRGQRIILGGHSAGGAIAQLLTLKTELAPEYVVTFGAPRVFSPDTASMFSLFPWQLVPLVYGDDPVPRFPLQRFRWLFGQATYAHAETPSQIDKDGTIRTERKRGTMAAISKAAWDVWMWGRSVWSVALGRLPKMIEDHSMSRYLMAVEAACRREGLIA